jgi:hypothetical protein
MYTKNISRWFLNITALILAFSVVIFRAPANAACATPSTTAAVSQSSVNVQSSTTYRAWVRLKAADTATNSVSLDIGTNYCNIVVGNSPKIPANDWTWVDYKDAGQTSKIDLTLASGSHLVTIKSQEHGTKVDRILLIPTSSGCIPKDTGENCTVVTDTTGPDVRVTSPSDGDRVSGMQSVCATANDISGVASIALFVDTIAIGTITKAPFCTLWDSGKYAEGTVHQIVAQAIDTLGNTASSSAVSVTTSTVSSPQSTSTTLRFSAIDDAMVKDGAYSTKNYGRLDRLRLSDISSCLKRCQTLVNRRSYLKFKVDGVTSLPKSVKLKLYTTDGGSDGGRVYAVSNNTWTESLITWDNAPQAITPSIGQAGIVKSKTWVEVTLDATKISKDGIYSLMLKNDSSDLIGYMSSEDINEPELIINL